MVRMASNGIAWQLVSNSENDCKWYGMVQNGNVWYKMVSYGTEVYQMVPNGTERYQMVPNGTKWYQMTFTIHSGYIHDTVWRHSRIS